MTRPARSAGWRLTVVASLIFATAWAAALSAIPDPFYVSRLREGSVDLERGEYRRAAESLRIACFGLLEEEDLLAECLVSLALAAVGEGDLDAFETSFRRIVEAEQLVGLYTGAQIPPELLEKFELEVSRRVAAATLRDFVPLSHLVTKREDDRLAGLSPRHKRHEIARRQVEEPEELRWPLTLAQLEHDEDRPREALAAAAAVLELDPDHDQGRCIRGWALSRQQRCASAIAALESCAWIDELDFAVGLLACHVELEQWQKAAAVRDELPDPWAATGRVSRLGKVIDRRLARAEKEAEQVAGADEIDDGGEPIIDEAEAALPGTGKTGPVSELTAAEEKKLAAAESIAGRAHSAQELREAYRLISEVAAGHDDRRDIHFRAAEIAYRASRWQDAVRHFGIAGDPGDDEPHLLFYLAVSLYEEGDREQAAEVLRRCVDSLRRTPFVESYVDRILESPRAGAGDRP